MQNLWEQRCNLALVTTQRGLSKKLFSVHPLHWKRRRSQWTLDTSLGERRGGEGRGGNSGKQGRKAVATNAANHHLRGRKGRTEGEQTAPPSPSSSPSTDSDADDDACYAPIFADATRLRLSIGKISRMNQQPTMRQLLVRGKYGILNIISLQPKAHNLKES